MLRRNLLRGMVGILAAGSAPAIITNAMKISVPKIIVPPSLGRGMTTPIYHLDEFFARRHHESMQDLPGLHRRQSSINTDWFYQPYAVPLRPLTS